MTLEQRVAARANAMHDPYGTNSTDAWRDEARSLDQQNANLRAELKAANKGTRTAADERDKQRARGDALYQQNAKLRSFVERAGVHLREDGFDWHTDSIEWTKTGLALGAEARALLQEVNDAT